MKLRNKRTGEIGTLIVDGAYKFVTNFAVEDDAGSRLGKYDSLVELNEEWEDEPEEPKKYWYITGEGDICRDDIKYSEWIEERKAIGNYFETKEEAEKAVDKLKAWKRLKDKGFEFTGLTRFYTGRGSYAVNYSGTPVTISFNKSMDVLGQDWIKDNKKDLYTIFGGEE